MPLVLRLQFEESRFRFEEGQEVPDHFNVSPLGHLRDLGKYAVLGELTGSALFYPAAINIEDLETAELLAAAYLRRSEDYKKIGNTYAAHILSPYEGGERPISQYRIAGSAS